MGKQQVICRLLSDSQLLGFVEFPGLKLRDVVARCVHHLYNDMPQNIPFATLHAVASSSVLLQVHCLNLSTCIESKPCVILRISCIRSFVVLHRQYSVLDILSVLVVPVRPDLDLDSGDPMAQLVWRWSLPALTDCRWWFEFLLVHSEVSRATRRKTTGADHKKMI